MSRAKILVILLLGLASQFLQAKEWSANDIPMVHLRDARKYVCDPEGIMSPDMKDSTDFYIHQLENETGIQTVYVIVSRVLNGDVFRVAQDIGNRQGVGDKKTNRGLVVVVSVDDKKYFIAPGEGLEADLTDLECDLIGRECIVKNMRQDNADRALLSTAKTIYFKFKTGKILFQDTDDADGSDAYAIVVIIIVAGWLIWAFYGKNNGGKGGPHGRGGGGFGPMIWGNPGHLNDRHFGGGFSGGGSFGGGSFGGGGAGGGW